MAPASGRRGGHSPAGGRQRWCNPASPTRESRPGSRRTRCATGGGGLRRNPSPRRHAREAAATGRRKAPPRHPRTHADRSLASWRLLLLRRTSGRPRAAGGRTLAKGRSQALGQDLVHVVALLWLELRPQLVERAQVLLLLRGAQLRQLVDQRVDACHVGGRMLVFGGDLFAHLLDFAQTLATGRRKLLKHRAQRLALPIVEIEIVRHRLQWARPLT